VFTAIFFEVNAEAISEDGSAVFFRKASFEFAYSIADKTIWNQNRKFDYAVVMSQQRNSILLDFYMKHQYRLDQI